MGGEGRIHSRQAHAPTAETEESKKSSLSILAQLIRRMCFSCCCPISKTVKVLSCFDTFIVAWFAYSSHNAFISSWNNLSWISIVSTVFFFSFLVCHVISTIFIILASFRNVARYCLPKLVLTAGLAICSLAVIIFMFTYFSGSSQNINEYLFKSFEYFYNEPLSDVDRVEMKHQLRYYGIAVFLLASIFFAYNIFQFWLIYKFKCSLNDFAAVPTEASAPQMSHNPEFSAPQQKVFYPNVA